MLQKKVGDFTLAYAEKGKTIKEIVQNGIKRIGDIEDYYNNYVMGYTEEQLLIHYDYADGGKGSTGLCLKPYLDYDKFFLSIEVYSEFDGHVEYDISITVEQLMDNDIKEEDILL